MPTPEKLNISEIRKDLEWLGIHIKLKIYFDNERTEIFSEVSVFKIPCN